jgi:iron(III) transport system substrate-binding protein
MRSRAAFILAVAVVCTGFVEAAHAQTYEPGQELAASAAVEGAVVVLSTTDAEEVSDLLAGFRSLHPDLRVDYAKEISTAIDERIRHEADGGGTGTVDLVWSSAMDLQLKLVNDGYAQAYASPALDRLPSWAVWKNEAYGITAEPVAIAFQKRLLGPGEVPHTRSDLIRLLRERTGALAGRVATYDPERSGVGYLFLSQDLLVTDRTWSLIGAMAQAGTRLYASTGEILDGIVSGELLLAYNVIGSYALDRTRTAPALGVILPADYTLVMSRVALIPRTAPHPSAARLFLDHLLSASGQQALAAHAIGPVRDDVTPNAAIVAPPEAARPIPLGLGLLAGLDQMKRARFLRDWRASFAAGRSN